MATKQQSVIADLSQGYVRGDVRVGIDQASAIRARLLLAFFEKYYPQYYTKEYALFRERIRLSGIQETPEDDRYTEEILAFVQSFERSHPDVEQQLQVVAPKEMVKLASEGMVEDIKARRAEIQLRAHELVKTYALRLNSAEQQGLEDDLVKTLSSSTSSAQTPQELRAVLEKELTQILTTNPDTKNKFSDETVRGQAVKESVRRVVDADPTAAQRILFSDVNSGELIFQQVSATDPPLWQPYVAAINNLPMADKETREEFITRALDVTKTTAVLSSDLWQAPAVRVGPSGFVSAILEAGGNKDALRAFGKLTEQAKNMVSLAVVSKSWNVAVEAITQRAGGTVTGALEEIIKQGNAQWGAHSGEPLGKAGSAVAGVLEQILAPTFINHVAAQSLLQTLGGQDGNRVTAFIKSLPAAQHDEGAASAALFLAITTTWRPGDLQFEWQQTQDGGGLEAWAVHIAKDSVLEKLFSKFVKSKAVEAAGGVVKKGGASLIAGLLTKLGLSAAVDVVIPMIGTPVATAIKWAIQAAIWLGGYIWRPVSNFLGKLTRGEIAQLGAAQNAIKQTLDSWLGPRPPAAPKQWYEQDWVVAALVVAAAVFLPMLGAMHLFTTRDSALFVASFPSNTGGPYVESFPPYYGPFPEESPPLASCPVSSAPITQKPFGDFSHEGVCAYDFGSQKGALVYATHDGCVAALRSDVPNDTFIEGEFGNYVRLAGTSPSGHYYTVYAHLVQGSGLSAGACVKAGDVIGRVDTTGFTFDSTGRRGGGTHLHYQYNDDQKTCPSLPTGCGY